jgi:hypothetical protein
MNKHFEFGSLSLTLTIGNPKPVPQNDLMPEWLRRRLQLIYLFSLVI